MVPNGGMSMVTVNPGLCVGCSLCVPICPEEVISCFGVAEIGDACTECLTCLEFCPVNALEETERGKEHA